MFVLGFKVILKQDNKLRTNRNIALIHFLKMSYIFLEKVLT